MVGRTVRTATIVAAGLLAIAPTSALAKSDAASTHAYVVADYALAKASEALVPKAQKRIASYRKKVGGECAHIGEGSPQTEKGWKLSYEVVGALWSLSYGTDAGAIHKFMHTVKGLSWSNSKTTKIARTYATSLGELASLPMPDLCKDIKAWTSSEYETVPSDTLQFDNHAEAIELHTMPEQLIAPYLTPADRHIVARTEKLEEKLLNTETFVGANDWFAMLETLSLNQ
ncbi:MAG TPA: hypothetical protein VGF95_04470 [Solirubrobacteraceae bacterium]